MNHHIKAYPASNYFSDSYIDPGEDSFIYQFAPLFVAVVVIQFILLPLGLFIAAFVTTSVYAYATSYAHDSYHIRNHWLNRLKHYREMRALHYIHHVQMNKNMGIISSLFDKVFRRYRRDLPGRPNLSR